MNAQQSFSAAPLPPTDVLPAYRALSALAAISLLLGLLSFLALAHPAAWFIPSLAIGLGLVALRRIRRRPEALMGAGLAMVGVTLALFFLCWAPTSYFADRWLIQRQARQFCEQWLSAVLAGETGTAYQATLPVRTRQPVGTALDEYYELHELERVDRDAYFQEGVPRQLAELQGQARFEFDRNLGIDFDPGYLLVTPRYFLYRQGEAQPALHLQMEVLRESDRDGVYWTLIKLVDADDVDRRLQSRHRPR
jgi:hypothetical protein